MDVALRVAERVTMMHNGRIFKEGAPEEIEADPEVQAALPGEAAMRERGLQTGGRTPRTSLASTRARGPALEIRRPACPLRGLARRAGRRPHAGRRRALGGGPQRHGQDDALQGHHGAGAGLGRLDPLCRAGAAGAGAGRSGAARRRLRAAGPPAVAVAHGGRASQARRHKGRRLDRGADLRDLPAPGRAQEQRRRAAVGRRAADAGDLAGPSAQPAPAHHGRADRGARARHRGAGRGDADCGSARTATSTSWSSSRTSGSRPRSRTGSPSW